jgi:hypothetical protein
MNFRLELQPMMKQKKNSGIEVQRGDDDDDAETLMMMQEL